MAGIKIVLPTTFTDASLPVLQDDPVLPNAGALLLIEPNHPSNPTSAVTNGTTLPNIAYTQAKAMYPAGTTTSLGGNIFIGAPFLTGGLGLVERSGKGGIHFAIGNTNDSPSTRIARVEANADVWAYMNANQGHSYFVSSWAYITRAMSPNTAGGAKWGTTGASFQGPYFYMRPTGNLAGESIYPVDGRRIGARAYGAVGTASSSSYATSKTDTGPALWNGAVSNLNAAIAAGGMNWNNSYPGTTSPAQPHGTSTIFYRTYVEDLTVSGRTYAQVDALDWAEYQKQVLTSGGRYYGDTFTSPTTLP